MGIRLEQNMVNNMVNNIYRLNGKDPRSERKEDGIKTSDGVKKRFNDSLVTSDELKRTLNNPGSSVALSLRDTNHPERAANLADELAEGLDGADGRRDGLVSVKDTSFFAAMFGTQKSAVSRRELADALSEGRIVVGEGGMLLSREEAKAHGDTIIAIHENNSGPKIALDQ